MREALGLFEHSFGLLQPDYDPRRVRCAEEECLHPAPARILGGPLTPLGDEHLGLDLDGRLHHQPIARGLSRGRSAPNVPSLASDCTAFRSGPVNELCDSGTGRATCRRQRSQLPRITRLRAVVQHLHPVPHERLGRRGGRPPRLRRERRRSIGLGCGGRCGGCRRPGRRRQRRRLGGVVRAPGQTQGKRHRRCGEHVRQTDDRHRRDPRETTAGNTGPGLAR
jgi:hypothetical protein